MTAKRVLTVALVAAVAAGGAVSVTLAQPAKAPLLNSLGQPDLSGSWTNATLTPLTRAANVRGRLYSKEEIADLEGQYVAGVEKGSQPTLDAKAPAVGGIIQARGGANIDGNYNRSWFDPGSQVMRVGGEPRSSILTTENGQVPARKAGATPAFAGRGGGGGGSGRDNPETMSNGDRCLISFGRNGGPPMLSNGFYNNNYQIVQSRDAVAIVVEMVHDTRIVRLNGAHRTDGVRPWFGDSIGRYEGKTLVVETTNIPERQAYNGSWRNLKVTERFTRVAQDRLLYQFTIEDPDTWAAPWGGEYEFGAQPAGLFEYACHEGNYAMEGILAGARAEERAAAALAPRAGR